MGSFAFNWTQSGNINDTRVCAGAPPAEFALNPGETWSVKLIVPDLGQTTRLEKQDGDNGDGQKAFLGAVLPKPLSVKASGTDNAGNISPKGGLSIAWTVRDPNGAIVRQFGSVTDNQTGVSNVAVDAGNTPGIYSILANCSACTANQQVTFTMTAVTPPKAKTLGETTQGSCRASIKPPPPPHEVCPGGELTLKCDTCNPTTAQRTHTWKTTSPAKITPDMQVRENAIFSSPQEGDYPVDLIYNPHLGVASGNCNASTTVKVRNAEVVGLTVVRIDSFPIISFGNRVSAVVGDKFYFYVQLNGPYADTTGFGFITIQSGAPIVTQNRKEGSRLRYVVELPTTGSGKIVVTGCAMTQETIELIVQPPSPEP